MFKFNRALTPLFDLMPRWQVPRCPTLLSGAALSGLVMSVLAISAFPSVTMSTV